MFIQKIKNLKHLVIAIIAYWFYGRPARKLVVVGVTGTKGKSTTCRFIASVLQAGGYKVGLLSTVEFQIGEKRWLNDKKMTMLGLGQIQKMLSEMVKAGCQYVVVETSSEGILQYRHYGLHYDICVFTNLGTEHSERHGGFNNLRADKGKMIEVLKNSYRKKINGITVKKIIIANLDDDNSEFYLNYWADKKFGFTLKNNQDILANENFSANILSSDESGAEFLVDAQVYKTKIFGDFNVYNALAAVVVGKSQNISEEKIAVGIADVKKVDGRMEFINVGQNFKVVVDYAHEPLSLKALFENLHQITKGKIIAVIGSDGGGRDKNKRKKMGEIVGQLCDVVVITDVNCYDEKPEKIAETLVLGARESGKKDGENLFIQIDRYKAIEKACDLAQAGDVVAITAKGTEPYIAVARGQKIPWSDTEKTKEILQRRLK